MLSSPFVIMDSQLLALRSAFDKSLPYWITSRQIFIGAAKGVVIGWSQERFAAARELCLRRNIPVVLAGAGPLKPLASKTFSDPASIYWLPISFETMERCKTLEEAFHQTLASLPAVDDAFVKRIVETISGLDPAFSAFTVGGERTGDKRERPTALSHMFEASASAPASQRAAFLMHACFFPNPYGAGALELEVALAAFQAFAAHARENQAPVFCFGAQFWNHASISAIFGAPEMPVAFCKTAEEAIAKARDHKGRVLSWAGKTTEDMERRARAESVPLLRIEDGFIRSVGLGAGLTRGASLAFDDEGIYFDATRPSRMERLLQNADVSLAQRRRAEGLRAMIVSARITKYNVGRAGAEINAPSGREVVLAPGQVADDAGVRKSLSSVIDCASCENVNLELLKAVRARNPNAFIVFKPHPDVQTGLRRGKLSEEELSGLADFVANDAGIIDLIEQVDRIETFSSLSGFEALLRGKPVTVYGMPFYAGWGLTNDVTPCARRTRIRTLNELIYISLVEYARSIDPVTLKPCTPEFLIERLQAQKSSGFHRAKAWLLRELSWVTRKLGV